MINIWVPTELPQEKVILPDYLIDEQFKVKVIGPQYGPDSFYNKLSNKIGINMATELYTHMQVWMEAIKSGEWQVIIYHGTKTNQSDQYVKDIIKDIPNSTADIILLSGYQNYPNNMIKVKEDVYIPSNVKGYYAYAVSPQGARVLLNNSNLIKADVATLIQTIAINKYAILFLYFNLFEPVGIRSLAQQSNYVSNIKAGYIILILTVVILLMIVAYIIIRSYMAVKVNKPKPSVVQQDETLDISPIITDKVIDAITPSHHNTMMADKIITNIEQSIRSPSRNVKYF